jgi:hypothetical protein
MLEGTLTLLLLVLLISWLVFNHVKSQSLPPGPFAWPVIGNIRLFQKDPQGYKKFMLKNMETYTGIYFKT